MKTEVTMANEKPKGLTPEQEDALKQIKTKIQRETVLQFIRQDCSNQTQAYLTACEKIGKKPSKNPGVSACEILKVAKVAEFLSLVRQPSEDAVKNEAGLTLGSFEHKKQLLLDVALRCAQGTPVLNMKGEQVYVDGPEGSGQVMALWKFEHKGVVSAVAELNKMDGDHAAQRVDLTASEDLVDLIRQGRSRTHEK